MSKPIVIQLQELASDSKHDISDLLRNALLVATKLKLLEFRKWILGELDGYEAVSDVPKYRVLSGELRVQHPFRSSIPFIIENAELAEACRTVHLKESISSIMKYIESCQPGQQICYFFPPEVELSLMRMQEGMGTQLKPFVAIDPSRFISVINTVRTRLLDWALSLESEGILGDGLSFSDNEKNKAMVSQDIKIENFQGIIGNIHEGASVSQTNAINIVSGNFSSLSHFLEKQGLLKEDLVKLEAAIKEDPEPLSKEQLGKQVSSWIGKMIAKAADGSWNVGISTAGTLLASAISKFYGL